MKRFSLAIHDFRVSGAEATVFSLQKIQKDFPYPLTVHLVCDAPLLKGSQLAEFLIQQSQQGSIEVVFHGLSHACPTSVGKRSAWFHKHQAEYLLGSSELVRNTQEMYQSLVSLFSAPLGICPPCWLASANNRKFLQSLAPAYIEGMLSLRAQGKRTWSPIVSLGSPNLSELFYLRRLGSLMCFAAMLLPRARVRVALHTCDLLEPSSMIFFANKVQWLLRRGVHPVLQRNLLQ